MDKKDLDKYDRQARVIGVEAMKRIKESKILIVGLGGLGVETGLYFANIRSPS
jgi:molybdopterin/thiamine biosynthesis adenylyltransferase